MEREKSKWLELVAGTHSKGGNAHCGDTYFFVQDDTSFVCLLADGLGSGRFAYESSYAALEIVEREWKRESIEGMMDLINKAMFQKRGAAVALFKVDFETKTFDYTCVGNIRFYLYGPDGKLTYPLPVTGYLSGRPQRYRMERFVYQPGSKFLVHSDGVVLLNTKELMRYRSTEQIAAELDAVAAKSNDDATFLVGNLL